MRMKLKFFKVCILVILLLVVCLFAFGFNNGKNVFAQGGVCYPIGGGCGSCSGSCSVGTTYPDCCRNNPNQQTCVCANGSWQCVECASTSCSGIPNNGDPLNPPTCTYNDCGAPGCYRDGISYTYKCGTICYDKRCGADACSNPCTPSTSCSCSPLSDTETSYGSKTVTCPNGCGGEASSTCWCTSACTPTSCPAGTIETDTGDHYDTYSCTNDCSVTQNRNCYCSICTPAPCPSFEYSDTNLGYGQVPNNLTPSCRNGQGASDNQIKCDMTYRTCYCYSCLKQCPAPLLNTGA
jgi:hypothetical protein